MNNVIVEVFASASAWFIALLGYAHPGTHDLPVLLSQRRTCDARRIRVTPWSRPQTLLYRGSRRMETLLLL